MSLCFCIYQWEHFISLCYYISPWWYFSSLLLHIVAPVCGIVLPVVLEDHVGPGKRAEWGQMWFACISRHQQKLLDIGPVSLGSWLLLERTPACLTSHGMMSFQTLAPNNLHCCPHAELEICLTSLHFHLQSTNSHVCINIFITVIKQSYVFYDCSPVQIQCGRRTSSSFPSVTLMSIRGPAGM